MNTFPTQRPPSDPPELTTRSLVTVTRAAANMLVAAVDRDCLPEPRFMDITATGVHLNLASPADVAAWAKWLDGEYRNIRLEGTPGRFHGVEANRPNGLRVQAYFIEYVGDVAA